MTKWQKISFRVFIAFFALAVMFSYVVNSGLLAKSEKPWHMQPFIDEDSLSASYMQKYSLLDKMPILSKVRDSSKVTVVILVDAWGVPFDETQLETDFDTFRDVPHKEYLHYRMANRTKHAENAEYHHGDSSSVYLFGGDSLEYNRREYISELGFTQTEFCARCGDKAMFAKLDSLLSERNVTYVAMTTQDAHDGNREKLSETLTAIANLAKKHTNVQFIVMGTHRPNLGTPEIRRVHYAHWVPVVVVE